MASIIQQLYTAVAGRIPSSLVMLKAQLALNIKDYIIYTKDDDNAVVAISGKHRYSRFGLSANYTSAGANTRVPWNTTQKNELGLILDTSDFAGRLVIPEGPSMRLKITVYANWDIKTVSRNLSLNLATTATGTAAAAPNGVRLVRNYGANEAIDGHAFSGWNDYAEGSAIDIGINSSTANLTTLSWVEIEREI